MAKKRQLHISHYFSVTFISLTKCQYFGNYVVATIDRVAGDIMVDLASFIPANMIAAPTGTTHFKIILAGAEIDFEAESFIEAHSETAILPWDSTATAVISQTNAVTPASTKPLFLALGVEFYQQVNGQMYPLKNGAFNPLALVSVSGL